MEKKRKENLTFEGVVCFAISEYFSGQKNKNKNEVNRLSGLTSTKVIVNCRV